MEVKEVMAIDLTARFGAGIEPSAADCALRYANWFDGMKSSGSSRVKAVGKNLLPTDPIEWERGTFNAVAGGRYSSNKAASTTRVRTARLIKVKPQAQHAVSWSSTYDLYWDYYDINGVFLQVGGSGSAWATNSPLVFTPPAGAEYIAVAIRYDDNVTQVYTNDLLAIKPQIELGSTATAYEPYTETPAYTTPALRSLPNGVRDEVDVVTGTSVQRVQEYTLVGGNILGLFTELVNIDYVTISKPSGMLASGDSQGTSIVTSVTAPSYGQSVTDVATNIWKHYANPTNWVITVPKGTYANLAAAQTAFAGTKIVYQLAAPITTYSLPQPLLYKPLGSIIFDLLAATPSDTVIPSFQYTYPTASDGIVDGAVFTINPSVVAYNAIGKFNNGLLLRPGSNVVFDETINQDFTVTFYTTLPKTFNGDICTLGSNNEFRLFYDGSRFGFQFGEFITVGRVLSLPEPTEYIKIGIKHAKVIIQTSAYTEILS